MEFAAITVYSQMTYERLLQRITSVLIMADYAVSERCGMRPRSFDLIARRGDEILVIRIVVHIDSMNEEIAHELAAIAHFLKGKPLVVGEKARDTELERGAVYLRYGIISTSAMTLYDLLVEKIPPLVYAQPGGLYVNIDGGLLRTLREECNMSLGDLASALGVSRRTISKYESGMGTTLDVASRMEEIFDTALVEAIDLLSHPNPFDKETRESPAELLPGYGPTGVGYFGTRNAPFEGLAFYGDDTILTSYGPAQKVMRRAALIANLSSITHSRAVCVIKGYHKQKRIGIALIIGDSKFDSLESGSDLINLIDD
jgi:putative transcriptional regulator